MTVDAGDYALGARAHGGLQMSDDYLFVACHGGTHIDALCHVFVDDLMYNGHSSSAVRSSGARLCGIDKMPATITRGVLLDVAQHRGCEHLDVGHAITARDLNECAESQGVSVLPGDAVLVRTGHLGELYRGVDARLGEPGLGVGTAGWCAEHKISVIGADNHGVEVKPSEAAGANSPLHIEFLRNQGLPMIELLDLTELSREGIYEFLFIAIPLKIAGGAGSPINPIAVV
jgi:kynurenine formamidase